MPCWSDGAFTAICAWSPGRIVLVATRNEWVLPAEVQDTRPVPPENVCPVSRSATFSRGIFPRAWPETPGISSRFRIWDSSRR